MGTIKNLKIDADGEEFYSPLFCESDEVVLGEYENRFAKLQDLLFPVQKLTTDRTKGVFHLFNECNKLKNYELNYLIDSLVDLYSLRQECTVRLPEDTNNGIDL